MPRSLDEIRNSMDDVGRTPRDKGYETTINLIAYDNGLIKVNGTPVRGTPDNWPMVMEAVVATVNEFRNQVERRRR